MASSKSGLTKEQRERFLLAKGYVRDHNGKGSHQIWVHEELRRQAQMGLKVEAPQNLLSNTAQKPWVTVLPSDPANGTWAIIEKLANWCEAQASTQKVAAEREAQRQTLIQQMRRARDELCNDKREAKNLYKMGLDPTTVHPGKKYDNYQNLRAQIRSM